MKRIPLSAKEAAALACLAGIAAGLAIVASPGWALVVVSALVLVYIILPDQTPGGPAQ